MARIALIVLFFVFLATAGGCKCSSTGQFNSDLREVHSVCVSFNLEQRE